MEPIVFETHPSRYRHWKLDVPTDGSGVATLSMAVDERAQSTNPAGASAVNSSSGMGTAK